MRRTTTSYPTVAAIALVIALASSPLIAGEEPEAATAIFHEVVQQLVDAENRGDVETMGGFFTDDAILLPPVVEEPIQGKDKIRAFLKEYAKHKMDNHEITPAALLVGGPKTMIDTGTWSGDVPAQDGAQPTHVTGTYLAVGVLVDGQWKLWANSWQMAPFMGALVGSSTLPQAGTSTTNK